MSQRVPVMPTSKAASETPAPDAADPVAASGLGDPVKGREDGLVVDDLLVEDVSIDGMCGVY